MCFSIDTRVTRRYSERFVDITPKTLPENLDNISPADRPVRPLYRSFRLRRCQSASRCRVENPWGVDALMSRSTLNRDVKNGAVAVVA